MQQLFYAAFTRSKKAMAAARCKVLLYRHKTVVLQKVKDLFYLSAIQLQALKNFSRKFKQLFLSGLNRMTMMTATMMTMMKMKGRVPVL